MSIVSKKISIFYKFINFQCVSNNLQMIYPKQKNIVCGCLGVSYAFLKCMLYDTRLILKYYNLAGFKLTNPIPFKLERRNEHITASRQKQGKGRRSSIACILKDVEKSSYYEC